MAGCVRSFCERQTDIQLMIAILGAMEVETELLLEQLSDGQLTEQAGVRIHRGRLHGREVLLATCGIGKVNAARVATMLISAGAGALVFTGVAGALDPQLEPGDVVISSDCVQHDVDVTALGYAPAEIPGEPLAWQADSQLLELAQAACRDAGLERSFTGRVLSGDTFLADPERAALLHRDLHGSCVEMEGAAVAQVCAASSVPFVVIRSVSDRADGSASPDFREFTALAARRSAAVVEALLKRL